MSKKPSAKGRSFLILLFVLVAFFQGLNPTVITEPLNNRLNSVFAYLPQLFGAGASILIAWVTATVLRCVILAVLQAVKLNEKVSGEAAGKGKPLALSKTLSDVVYCWCSFCSCRASSTYCGRKVPWNRSRHS